MLDRKFIVENARQVQENCDHRGVTADVARFVELDARRKSRQTEIEKLNRCANEVAKSIGQAADAATRDERKEEGRRLRQEIADIKAEIDQLEVEQLTIQATIPNMSHPDAPVGVDDGSNREIARGKLPPREFAFKPLDHVELGEKLDLIDFESGARVTGAGFYFLKNEAVLLELALQQFAVRTLLAEGFTPAATPDLARNDVLQGIGFIPRGPETQIYSIEGTDLSLVATAEITLGGLLAGRTVDAESLPMKFCGTSHCFRTEAGAAGRASRGLYRVHQFTKVEMFAFTLPEQSEATHQHFLDMECRLFDALEIPYRVVDTATGDLGGPAYRKYDLEAWMPGRGGWGEVTSASNCTDYQARRLDARYKIKGEKGTHFVHTLNGTAVAISRAIISILENHQQADGSVVVPEVLRPMVGKERIEARR